WRAGPPWHPPTLSVRALAVSRSPSRSGRDLHCLGCSWVPRGLIRYMPQSKRNAAVEMSHLGRREGEHVAADNHDPVPPANHLRFRGDGQRALEGSLALHEGAEAARNRAAV